jgi:hypothetical protein
MIGPVSDGRPCGLERAAWLTFLGFVATIQVSIAISQSLLAITAVLWLALIYRNRERIEVPGMFWPLAVYAGVTMLAALFSVHREISIVDTKQIVLFAIVPIAYRLLQGRRSLLAVDIIITVGAIEAVVGIVQYAVFDFDHLGQRVQGSLTHYMTYSGVLMLVACTAAARILFRSEDRVWPPSSCPRCSSRSRSR